MPARLGIIAGRGTKAVQINLARSSLRQRFIALVAAYAIALAGLLATFGGAQMAAAAAAQPGGVICHTDFSGNPAPSPDDGAHHACLNDCCTGCLMLTAALPPPPATAIALMLATGECIAPAPVTAVVASPQTKSHHSRAPPQSL
jgi:hypothetical protein